MSSNAEHFFFLREADPVTRSRPIWVPSDGVLFLSLDKPAAPRGKWQKLLPWLLEDHLLDEPHSQHLVIDADDSDDKITVLALPREQLRQWREHCGRMGYQPAALAPDVLALPWEQGAISVYLDGERVLVRTGYCQGFAGPSDWVWSLLRHQGEADKLMFFGDAGQAVPEDLLQGRPVVALPDPWRASPALGNLLTGEFAARPAAASRRKPWWAAGIAAGVALVAYLALLTVEAAHFRGETEQLAGVVESDFRTLYGQPLDGDISELRSEVEYLQRLQARTSTLANEGLWSLLQQIDPVLSSCGDCRLRALSADEGGLLIRLQGTAGEALAGLQNLPGVESRAKELEDGQEITLVRRAAL